MSTPDTAPSPRSRALLLGLSIAASALAVFQWTELFVLARGGKVICSLNETVDCGVVWKSEFAQRLHALTGLPVAGLGLAWGLAAVALSALLWRRVAKGKESHVLQAALRGWGAVGALSCITFAVASYRLGTLCLTCLGTYVLVTAFAAVALFLLPDAPEASLPRARSAAGTVLLTFAPLYLVLLFPGSQTPRGGEATALSAGAGADPALFAQLGTEEKQFVALAVAAYKASPAPDVGAFPTRLRKGPADAAVRVVDFTDILCPHCALLVKQLEELERLAPKGSLSVEARQFPLDSECNPVLQATRGDGIRCTAAKAMICLESSPDFWPLRSKLFLAQNGLTKEQVLSIAGSGAMSRQMLEQCIAQSSTQLKLNEDVKFAMEFKPEGTPLVLVNGRATAPSPWFLYGMALAKGDIEAPWFKNLPAAAPQRHDHPH